ncbi:MAG: amino acid permease, partial [Pseudomonadota bacterium]
MRSARESLPARSRTAKLSREVGFGTAVAVVIGNTIGSGIFTTSGLLARDLGSPARLMLVWVAGGVIALAGALSYAELGAAMPEAGGEYVYLREAYGPLVAFLCGWTSFFVGFSGAIAAGLLAFAGYLERFVPAVGAHQWSAKAAALAALWTVTMAHVGGIGPSGRIQRGLTAAVVA